MYGGRERVWVDTYETVGGACVRDGVEDGAAKVVGILLEGEKYEPGKPRLSLPTACVRDRIERKRAEGRKA